MCVPTPPPTLSLYAMENGWFHERSPMWPGQAMSLEIKEVLLDMKSEFQHIVVFERYRLHGVGDEWAAERAISICSCAIHMIIK